MYEVFEKITKTSTERRKKLVRWFNHQTFDLQVEIFRQQRNFFFLIRNKYPHVKELHSIAAFYLSIEDIYNKLNSDSKDRSLNIDKLEARQRLAFLSVQKPVRKEKREKLLNLWSIVEELKKQGWSYRKIAHYLRTKHRFDVSHQYIRKVWKEMNDEEMS